MKNREIIEHINALGAFTKDKIPVKLSFAIVKNFNKLQDAYKDYDESRKALFESYADKENKEKIAEENREKWEKEINELLEIDVVVDVHMVDFAMLDGLQLSVSDMAAIEFMIKEE